MTFEEELAQPENEYISVIGNYLMERAKTDPSVANNLKKEKKSLKRCFQYIIDEAKKIKKGDCAMVKDDIVFGWAVHYYDEDNLSIDAVKKPLTPAKQKTEKEVLITTEKKAEEKKQSIKSKEDKKSNDMAAQLRLF